MTSRQTSVPRGTVPYGVRPTECFVCDGDIASGDEAFIVVNHGLAHVWHDEGEMRWLIEGEQA